MSISFETLKELKEKHQCDIFFETGFYVGKRFEYALESKFEKVISIEILQKFVDDGKKKFAEQIQNGTAEIILDDSSNMKNYLTAIKDRKILFWLDAHLDNGLTTAITTPKETCPLFYELQAIKDVLKIKPIILIDDLRIIKSYNDWGNGYKIEDIINKIYEIDKNYVIDYLDGTIEKDILVAY